MTKQQIKDLTEYNATKQLNPTNDNQQTCINIGYHKAWQHTTIGKVYSLSKLVAKLVKYASKELEQYNEQLDKEITQNKKDYDAWYYGDKSWQLITKAMPCLIKAIKAPKGIDKQSCILDGCMDAIKTYDASRGKFETYAMYQCQDKIQRAKYSNLANQTNIKDNIHDYKKMLQAIDQFAKQNQREPSNLEIQKTLGWTDSKIDKIVRLFEPNQELDNLDGDYNYNTVAISQPDILAQLISKETTQSVKDIITPEQHALLIDYYQDSKPDVHGIASKVGKDTKYVYNQLAKIKTKVAKNFCL